MTSIQPSFPAASAQFAQATRRDIPHAVEGLAHAFELGAFLGTQRHAHGVVTYEFERGGVNTARGAVSSVEFLAPDGGRMPVPADVARLAQYNRVGAFTDLDAAMGGHEGVNFDEGSAIFQNGAFQGLWLNRSELSALVPATVLGKAMERGLGQFVWVQERADGLYYVFQRGDLFGRRLERHGGVG